MIAPATARGVHEPEREPIAAQVVADDVRHQGLPRAPYGEQAQDRRGQRDEQPSGPPHETEPLDRVGPYRRVRLGPVAIETRADHHDHRRRPDEGAGVSDERPPRAEAADQEAAEHRAGHHEGERADELIDRVRLDEQLLGHDVGHDRLECRLEDRLPDPEDHDEADEDRDRELIVDRQEPDRRHRRRADQVAGDHEVTSIHAVGEHAGEDQE